MNIEISDAYVKRWVASRGKERPSTRDSTSDVAVRPDSYSGTLLVILKQVASNIEANVGNC